MNDLNRLSITPSTYEVISRGEDSADSPMQSRPDRDVETPPMRPVNIGGCFGWLHMPGPGWRKNTAVLLCPGLTHDAMTAHRSFRLLAQGLACAGYPALRFDYPGSGNSLDMDGADQWVAWRHSVQGAADWLLQHGGAGQLVLCGLRFGALLAAVVAERRSDVAGLILLAPVLRGRSYIRQLSVEATLCPAATQADIALEVNEYRLSRETIRRVSEVDIRKVVPRAGCQVVVYAQGASPRLSACTEAWSRCGAHVDCEDFVGLEPMLRPVCFNHESEADFSRVTEWLCRSIPSVPASERSLVPDAAELRPTGCIETPLQFGAHSRLFGVLCRPRGQVETGLAVLIGNTSADPHSGFARSSVNLSRRLAAAGIASLRFDFAGLADSIAPQDVASHVFENDRVPDFTAAIDALERLGYRRFAIHGLCSGAHHAFHAALADPRVGYLIAVNLPLFQWPKGAKIEYLNQLQGGTALLDRRAGVVNILKRLLRGEPHVRSRLVNIRVFVAGKVAAKARRVATSLGFRVSSGFAWDSLTRMSERTRTLLIVAEGDPSMNVLTDALGQNRAPRGTTIRVIAGLDHSLTRLEMQRVVAEEVISFLTART